MSQPSPWGDRFDDVEEQAVTIVVAEAVAPENESQIQHVELTALDQNPFLLLISITHFLVFERAIPEKHLQQGCRKIASVWPVLTGRSAFRAACSELALQTVFHNTCERSGQYGKAVLAEKNV